MYSRLKLTSEGILGKQILKIFGALRLKSEIFLRKKTEKLRPKEENEECMVDIEEECMEEGR